MLLIDRIYNNLNILDDAHKAVGILTIKNSKRIIGMNPRIRFPPLGIC
jgi:hypothetical protein